MERLQKALELARTERARKLLAAVPTLPECPAPAITQDTLVFSHTRVASSEPSVLRANGVIPADASGPAGHAFKMLRTQVLQRLEQHGWNTLAVVSPTPEDGKTFTAINLAIAIAGDTSHTTLLVDFDLRNPSVHQRFGIRPDIGVEQCLRGEAVVSQVLINPQGYPKLLLLPAREPVANSSSLLSSERTRRLTSELKERYRNRVVLFDLPPVLGADDALAFLPQVDAALVVVGAEHTHREDLVRCCEILRHIPVIGTVLNGSRTDTSFAYAY
jgi:Mrp family chromosome partitioning ATPase